MHIAPPSGSQAIYARLYADHNEMPITYLTNSLRLPLSGSCDISAVTGNPEASGSTVILVLINGRCDRCDRGATEELPQHSGVPAETGSISARYTAGHSTGHEFGRIRFRRECSRQIGRECERTDRPNHANRHVP